MWLCPLTKSMSLWQKRDRTPAPKLKRRKSPKRRRRQPPEKHRSPPIRRNRKSCAVTAHPRRIRRPLTSPSRPNETSLIPVYIPEVVQAPTMTAGLGVQRWPPLSRKCAFCAYGVRRHPSNAETRGALRVSDPHLYPPRRAGCGHLRGLRHNRDCSYQHRTPLCMF